MSRLRSAAAFAAIALTLSACEGGDSAGPPVGTPSPTFQIFTNSVVPGGNLYPEAVFVCKEVPTADAFDFTATSSRTGLNTFVPAFSLSNGQCRMVAQAGGALFQITVTETPSAGFRLDSIVRYNAVFSSGTLVNNAFQVASVDTLVLTSGNSATAEGSGSASGALRGGLILFYNSPERPAIDIEKATNGHDADTPTGPTLVVGSSVTWTYVVTNTGDVPLTSVAVTDDKLPDTAIDCGNGTNVIGDLAVGASATCTATGTAGAGQYANLGTTTGNRGSTVVTDSDPSHYYGETPTGGGFGCTPGFWQGGRGSTLWNVANDADWAGVGNQPYTHATKFFGTTAPYTSPFLRGNVPTGELSNTITMLDLVGTGGGPKASRKAARSAVAAYLNAAYSAGYPMTGAEIANAWNSAASIANATTRNAALLRLHTQLDEYNNGSCSW